MVRLHAWAAATPAELAPIFAAEAARWRTTLAWDTADLWQTVEQARTAGRLPGLVTRDDAGRITGWTYYLGRDGDLHCGALVAASAAETALLLDGIAAAPEAATAARFVMFAFAEAPGLDAALAGRGFLRDPYDYMMTPLPASLRAAAPGRAWDMRDLDATAALLGASYPAHEPSRPFAPHGRAAEWRQYVAELVMGPGCGQFRPSLSIAVPGEGGALDAVALVTDIGARSAHLAQLAVRRSLRGAGLGARLVAAVRARAAADGFARLTLLVGGTNTKAHRLYAQADFATVARFTCASRAARTGLLEIADVTSALAR